MPEGNLVNKKRNIFKTILYALLGLFILFTAAGFYFYSQRKPFLTQYLQKTLTKASKGLYKIQFSDLNFNLFSGNVDVKNIELIPDTATYTKFIALKTAPDNLYRIKIKELEIWHVAVLTALFQKKLTADSVLISRPDFIITNKKQPYNNDTVEKEMPKTLYQLIKKAFKQVQISGISLSNGNFLLVDNNGREVKSKALNNINIDAKEVLVNAASEKDASRFYYSKNMVFRIGDNNLATPDSLYYLTVKNVYFSTEKKQLLFNRIAFTPRYDKIAFYQKVKFSKNRYDLQFNTVAFNHIDLQLLVKQKMFFSSSADIRNADIEVYNNNAYPHNPSKIPHWDNFPQQQLQQLTVPVKIDTLNLKNINVVYAEADKDTKQTGFITFNQIGGQVFNITNDSIAKTQNQYATAKLNTRVLNSVVLNANFKFDLTDKKAALTYSGDLGPMDGTLFNKAAVPLGRVKINSLAIERLTFSAAADNYSSSGTLKMYYKNLKVELLKKADGENELQKRELISALGNAFILIDANPKGNGNFRIGQIKFKREIKMPFFYFIWQSVFTGIKSSVGLTAPKEKLIDTTTTQATTFFDRVKSFFGISKQKQRRERRKQKKASGQ